MSAPTICQACGGRIEHPAPDRHVCEKCHALAIGIGGDDEHTWVNRPDPRDLTQKLWRIRWKDEATMNAVAVWICIGFAACCFFIIAYWLGKQAGLWG